MAPCRRASAALEGKGSEGMRIEACEVMVEMGIESVCRGVRSATEVEGRVREEEGVHEWRARVS